jgi:hypothetical protein
MAFGGRVDRRSDATWEVNVPPGMRRWSASVTVRRLTPDPAENAELQEPIHQRL